MWRTEKKQKLETDPCVLCGVKTECSKDTAIRERKGYVEGAGQLCYDCCQDLYPKGQGCHG